MSWGENGGHINGLGYAYAGAKGQPYWTGGITVTYIAGLTFGFYNDSLNSVKLIN